MIPLDADHLRRILKLWTVHYNRSCALEPRTRSSRPDRPKGGCTNRTALHSEGLSHCRDSNTRWSSSRIQTRTDSGLRTASFKRVGFHFCGRQRLLDIVHHKQKARSTEIAIAPA